MEGGGSLEGLGEGEGSLEALSGRCSGDFLNYVSAVCGCYGRSWALLVVVDEVGASGVGIFFSVSDGAAMRWMSRMFWKIF